MKFYEFINEAKAQSNIEQQLQNIKNGEGEWEAFLRNVLLNKEDAFDWDRTAPRFPIANPKAIPKEIKLKYPDVVFFIQALQLHVSGQKYYKQWEAAKNYLTFKPEERPILVHRFWHDRNDEMLNKLRKDGVIYLDKKNEYMSYTLSNKLFRKTRAGYTITNISTEEVMATEGRGTFILTKHIVVPVFNLYRFYLHFKKAFEKVFGLKTNLGSIEKYSHEKEIIAKAIDKITLDDVVGYYKYGEFVSVENINVDDFKIEYNGVMYDFTAGQIETLIKAYKENPYDIFDYNFMNKYIFTENPEDSNYKRYVNKWIEVPEISDILGTDIYFGLWK